MINFASGPYLLAGPDPVAVTIWGDYGTIAGTVVAAADGGDE